MLKYNPVKFHIIEVVLIYIVFVNCFFPTIGAGFPSTVEACIDTWQATLFTSATVTTAYFALACRHVPEHQRGILFEAPYWLVNAISILCPPKISWWWCHTVEKHPVFRLNKCTQDVLVCCRLSRGQIFRLKILLLWRHNSTILSVSKIVQGHWWTAIDKAENNPSGLNKIVIQASRFVC